MMVDRLLFFPFFFSFAFLLSKIKVVQFDYNSKDSKEIGGKTRTTYVYRKSNPRLYFLE